jgi:ribonuclease Z
MTAALELVLLGTGSPMPNPDRWGAGQVVIAGGQRMLVDCGWGAGRRLFAAGLLPPMIDVAFFTHLHSDHITDIPDFLIMRWTGGAKRPLTVYGPAGTREMIDGFLAGLKHDIAFRFAHHGDKLSHDGIRCIVHEAPASAERVRVAEVGGATVDAFAVDHFPVEPALGFRFDRGGRSLVISGDTKACDSLVRAADGADLMLCEAMNLPMFRAVIDRLRAANPNTAALLDDATEYHTATQDVAKMAQEARVRHLVLTHLLPGIPPDQPALVAAFAAGMSGVFTGELTVGHDLQRFTIDE